jgi:hypothetical protein
MIKLVTFIVVASCLPALAAPLPSQGNQALVTGRAHVERAAMGTYIHVEGPGPAIAGFVPFGNEPTYPGLAELDGRHVAITGVVVRNGRAMIVLSDPAQLSVAG